MKTIRVMDKTGDTVVTFDETQVEATATQEAKALFDRLKKTGAVFDEHGNKVHKFTELGQDNLFVPAIVAG